MRWPALIPLIAVTVGVVCGCVLTCAVPVAAIASVLIVTLGVAGATYVRGSPLAFVIAVGATFVLAAWLLAMDAREAALRPTLLALVESGADGPAETLPDDPAIVLEIEGTVREDASRSTNGYSLSVDVDAVVDKGARREVAGGVLLTVFGELASTQAPSWLAGRRVRAAAQLRRPSSFRDPGVADHRLNLARRGTILVGSVKSAALVELCGHWTLASEVAARCRGIARRAVGGSVGWWSQRSAAIVTAILIGDRAGLDDEMRDRLQQAGTYHVIAISGGNIAILAGLVWLVLQSCGVGSRTSCVGTAAALSLYAGLVGGGASVVRATLMGVTYLLARWGDHRASVLNALAASVSIILVATPLAVFDPALILTGGATLGIIVGAMRAGSWLPSSGLLRAPATLGLASLSAELALFPVSASVFSRVTFAGLILNFAAIPLMTAAQVAGMAVIPLWLISGTLARVAGLVAHLGAAGLVESARLVDYAPWLALRVPPPGILVLSGYYAGWLVWLACTSKATCRRFFARTSACVVVVCGLAVIAPPTRLGRPVATGLLEVTFLDVGQADAILVRFPDGRSLLLDAGGQRSPTSFDVGARVVTPALWAMGLHRLDTLAISHGDPDHIGGAPAVLRDLRPREIWEGVPVPPDPLLDAIRRHAQRAGATWRTLLRGDRMMIGGVTVRVWHPPAPDWERQRVRNDDSLVLELIFGGVSILLPGDISGDVERVVAPFLEPASFRVLKVPHHGSASSSTSSFLAAVRPTVAILTVGRGTTIARDVLSRYRDRGVTLIRTDMDGAITLSTDGGGVALRSFVGHRWDFGPVAPWPGGPREGDRPDY